MPTDDELQRIYYAEVGDISPFRAGLRAVYEAGQADATAAERERCARIAEECCFYLGTDIARMIRVLTPEQYAAAAIRADREPEPLIECPHWSPGKITLRRDCTACAAAADREPEPATEAKTKDEAMVVCRIISAVDNNEYRGAKQLLASDWLRERDAEKWDEGHAYGFYDQSENTKHSNPYRKPAPATEEGSSRG